MSLFSGGLSGELWLSAASDQGDLLWDDGTDLLWDDGTTDLIWDT